MESGKPARELETARRVGSVEDEGWRVKKDRSLFWANVVITAIYDEDRRLVGYAKVTRDLTDKRKTDALEAADRQKNEFLAMLAHELRNPLAPIRSGLHLLKLGDIDPNTMQQTTDMMERQVVHLVRLVDDLLDVSRVITGKLTFKRQAIELSEAVQRAVEESRCTIDAHGHELMLSLPARPIIVDGDAHRLAQVIANLLENAAKYTEKPGQIWLSVERQGDEAVIRVRDPGIGIAAEVLPNVFSLFVQADNSLTRTRGGLGIGLNVVKRIVELHGGHVAAQSAGLGQGSEFTVRLPVSKSGVPVVEPKTSRRDERPKTPSRRILVVDDNVDAAFTVSALLKAWGHQVQAIYSGQAALEAVRKLSAGDHPARHRSARHERLRSGPELAVGAVGTRHRPRGADGLRSGIGPAAFLGFRIRLPSHQAARSRDPGIAARLAATARPGGGSCRPKQLTPRNRRRRNQILSAFSGISSKILVPAANSRSG